MYYKPILVLLTGFYLSEGYLTTPDSSVSFLLGDTYMTNVTVDYDLDNCTQLTFTAQIGYIAEVQKTRSFKQNNQLICEILLYGKDLGRTTIWANVTCSGNCTRFSEPFMHLIVEQSLFLSWASVVCGWTYFLAWTMSFYPQLYIHWSRKSVLGFNFDYVTLNQLGYLCYSMYNIGLYFIPVIEAEYYSKHPGATNPVQLNDLVFSLHGFIGTAVMILQIFMYERGNQTMSTVGVTLLSTLLGALGLILTGGIVNIITWLECLLYCSYIKLVITIIKYIPQVYMNYKLQSTVGWSIETVMLDSLGSVTSIFQMIILSYNRNDWVSIMGDPTKFGLGLFSAGFDVIFVVQHYILYRQPGTHEEKAKPKVQDTNKKKYSIPIEYHVV